MQPEKLVLFVDDEVQILRALERLLRGKGIAFVCESDTDKALEIVKSRSVSLVVADYRMPKMNGAEFLATVKKTSPNTVRMILSGFADQKVVIEAIKKGEVSQFITKPWNDDDLLQRIQSGLDSIPVAKTEEASGESPEVLILDDERGVLNSLNRLLRLNGWRVSTFDNPSEALAALKCRRFAVFISDFRMPTCTGVEVLEKAKTIAPETARILLTGYADGQAAVDAINRSGIFRYLNKPWNDELLLTVLQDGLKHYRESVSISAERAESSRRIDHLNDLLEQQSSELSKLQTDIKANGNPSVDLLRTTMRQFPTVSAHCERVAELAVRVGTELGLEPGSLSQLQAAARVHDIGEMGLPDSILGKERSQLTPGERKLLERHVTTASELILKLPEGEILFEIIRSHHENYDGSGYPQGIRHESIPLASRILAVVDTYDQTLYANSIFERTTPASVLKYIQSLSNRKWDAEVVRALTVVVEGSNIQKSGLVIRVRPGNLEPGMVIAKDLVTARGRSVLKEGFVLDAENIQVLLRVHENDPLVNDVWIKKSA